MLKVWGRRTSSNVQKVMWLVGELGLEHEHIPLGGRHGGRDAPGFLAMNPNGLVPVIDDDGVVVWDSHAILRYLAARYGGARFWAEDPAERSLADRWLDWGRDFDRAFVDGVFWGFYRTPEPQRDIAAVDRAVARSGAYMRILDGWLEERAYILGEALSLADIPAGSAMFRYFGLQIDRPTVPRVEAWYRRLCERPAYREHVMVPFEELKGRLAF